ncbi:MAG: hypothetical protein KF729_22585 [Sandaracinaceae bacterium]|nr:hypothetical protein [Sandaracinaceae bacterium]
MGAEMSTPVGTSRTAADTFAVSYDATIASNVRADTLMRHLSFWVYDEDVSANDFVGACSTPVSEATFTGGLQTMNCARNPSGGQAGFSLTWRLNRF